MIISILVEKGFCGSTLKPNSYLFHCYFIKCKILIDSYKNGISENQTFFRS